MKVIINLTIIIKKNYFTLFVNELYKRQCEIKSMHIVEENANEELYKFEIIYRDRAYFNEFIAKISDETKKFKVISIINELEELLKGGVLQVSSKFDLKNKNDFDINLLGSIDYISDQIESNKGEQYSGINKTILLLNGIKSDKSINKNNLLQSHLQAEMDSIIINRFCNLNAIPLVITYPQTEDLIKTINRIEQSCLMLRLIELNQEDIDVYEQIYSEIKKPILSFWLDDITLYILTIILKLLHKNNINIEEATVGCIGIEVGTLRLTRLLSKLGCYRVLGYDINDSMMLRFENQNGLGTTMENILSNADIIILFKGPFGQEEFQFMRPGQFIVSMIKDTAIDKETFLDKGIRDYIYFDKTKVSTLTPGLIRGLIDTGRESIDDWNIIELAKKMQKVMLDGYEFPDIFTNIHDIISDLMSFK